MEISYSCCLILNWPNLKFRNEKFLHAEDKDEDFDIAYGVHKRNFGAFPLPSPANSISCSPHICH